MLAAQHYRAHNTPETLKLSGGRLSYFFEDEGDKWSVMVAPYRNLRHNTVMSIRKSDRRVKVIEVRKP